MNPAARPRRLLKGDRNGQSTGSQADEVVPASTGERIDGIFDGLRDSLPDDTPAEPIEEARAEVHAIGC